MTAEEFDEAQRQSSLYTEWTRGKQEVKLAEDPTLEQVKLGYDRLAKAGGSGAVFCLRRHRKGKL